MKLHALVEDLETARIAVEGGATVVQWRLKDVPTVEEASGQAASLARFADWFVAKPLKILLIFLVALFVNRLLRRGIRRFVDRMTAVPAEQEVIEALETEAVRGAFASLRERAREKARLLTEQAERRRQRAQALGTVLRSVASLTVYALAFIIAIAEFGVSLGPLIAGAGIVGVAVGFGAQSLVRDFLSGIMMLIEDQYGIGDWIEVDGVIGQVERVGLRATSFRDLNGVLNHVLNGYLQRVGNLSQEWSRSLLDVPVALDADVPAAKALEVINASSGRSNVTENLVPQRVVTRAWPRTFRLALLYKDLDIAADVLRDAEVLHETIGLAWRLFAEGRKALGEEADHVEIIKLIEKQAGVEIK